MNKKIILLVVLAFLAVGGTLIGVFWDPILDWLPIDQSGWDVLENGDRCYLDEDGDPVSGWQELDGNTYYFDPETYAMQIQWLELNDGRYYLGDDGIKRTGWQTILGCRYYLGQTGAMHTGWLEQDGGRMYLNENGNPHSGWLQLEDGTYFLNEQCFMHTGWLELGAQRYYFDEDGKLHSGWLEQEEGTYYLGDDGIPKTGWLELEENVYYLDESGIMQTGWLELNGQTYYLKEDGTAAKGKLIIDDETFYFTSRGAQVILVNQWNMLPSTYEPEVVKISYGCWMARSCADATKRLLTDLESATGDTGILNGYRTYGAQYQGFYTKVQNLMDTGISYHSAYRLVSQSFAVPGSSEHQLGMALDIMGRVDLHYEYGDNEVMQWMKEHCWEYGFILRYPVDKTHITGIIYEPWHFRYVGTELAMELKGSGLCLEEYLDSLTNDGTTCGNPAARIAQ